MEAALNSFLSNIPITLVMGYFLQQFLKRLDNNIEKTDALDKRVFELEIRAEIERENKT